MPMTPEEEDRFNDLLNEANDILPHVTNVSEALGSAQCCETIADFCTNIDDALASAEELVKELRALKKEAK